MRKVYVVSVNTCCGDAGCPRMSPYAVYESFNQAMLAATEAELGDAKATTIDCVLFNVPVTLIRG